MCIKEEVVNTYVWDFFYDFFFSKDLERKKNPGHKCVLAAINDKWQDNHSQNSGTYAIKGRFDKNVTFNK